MVINCMIVHGHLPSGFMDTIVIPIVKDHKGDLSSVDNHRPIAITSIMSKMFEILILDRHHSVMETTSNQFGFKPKHGTDQSVFVLKQMIDFYKSNGSPLYLCYLDLSKAFDRVDHSLLFRKLLRRKLPAVVVRMLQNWYCTQSFRIQWGKVLSRLIQREQWGTTRKYTLTSVI